MRIPNIRTLLAAALLLVAKLQGKVVGYIHGEIVTYLLFAGREMLVSELFVMESARGRGPAPRWGRCRRRRAGRSAPGRRSACARAYS